MGGLGQGGPGGGTGGGLAGATRGRPASVAQYGLPPLRATECAPFVRMRGAADSRNLHNQTVSNAHPPPFSNSLGKPCVEAATRRRVLLVDGGRGRTAPLPPGSRQPSQEATFSILRNLPDLPQHALFHELRWRWCSDLIIMQLNANRLARECSHPQTIYLCPTIFEHSTKSSK